MEKKIVLASVCKIHWTKYNFSDLFCTIEIETIFALQLFSSKLYCSIDMYCHIDL